MRISCHPLVLSFFLFFSLVGGIGYAEVIPDYYAEPGINPFRDYQNDNPHELIDPFSGNLHHSYVDMFIPGNGGLDIKVQRAYNSVGEKLGFRTPTGIGWVTHFGRVLKKDVNLCSALFISTVSDNPVLELPDGSRRLLYWAKGVNPSGPFYLTTDRWSADCASNTSIIVKSPDGIEYTMSKMGSSGSGLSLQYEWYATQIKDRNGNTIAITYKSQTGQTLVDQVTSNDGRAVSFGYITTSDGYPLLSTVSANGQTWRYNYLQSSTLGFFFLTEVVRPDGARWQYSYNQTGMGSAGSGSMSKTIYPQGGVANYSYAFVYFDPSSTSRSVVVSGKTTNGPNVAPGTWNYAYAPAPSNDTTTVTTPNGKFVYKHFGYSASVSGTVWKVGLLLEKQSYTGGALTQTESYTWGSQRISSENYFHPTAFLLKIDPESYAAILTQKSVTLDGTTYTTSYTGHDAYGNPALIAETGNDTRQTNLSYYIDTSKWIVKQVKDETISGVGSITRQFNANGNLSYENRYGVTTGYQYFSSGDILSITNARGYATSYGNYYRGIARSESRPAGVNISRSVNATGTLASETDGRGYTHGFSYDSMNRLTGISYPVNSGVSISYTPTSRTLTRGAYQEIFNYDGFGRPIRQERRDNGLGLSIAHNISYNAVGQKTFESYPNSSSGTSFSSDILGRVTSMSHPDGTNRTFSYLSSNRVNVKNERGYTSTHTYRSFGDPGQRALVQLQSPESVTTAIARNKLDQITSVSQGARTRSYGYDSRYYLVSVANPETGTTTYGRDAVGNMTSRQIGGSATTGYTYDGLNRLASVNFSDPGTPDITYTYDANSNVTGLTSSAASVSYTYDPNDNLTLENHTIGSRLFAVNYSYNGLDYVSTLTYPGGKIIGYSPDAFGRPTTATPYVTAVAYHPNGIAASMSYANGVGTTTSLTTRFWPSRIYASKVSGVMDYTYSYDGGANVTGIADALGSASRSLSYDGVDRLIGASGSWGSGSFAYDATGNLTSQTLGSFALGYAYDGSNRLATVTGSKAYTFGYDFYGNVTSNGKDAMQYNEASNLTCINCGGASPVTQAYDGRNMRVLRQTGGKDTFYVYAKNGDLLWEYVPSDGTLKEHIYLSGKLVAERAVANLW